MAARRTTFMNPATGYLARVLEAIRRIDVTAVESVVDALVSVHERDGQVLIAGNGGSASTASHMATDLGVGSQRRGAGLRAAALTANTAVMTAIANDVAFDAVFAEQVDLLGRPGDVLIVISASGNSPNLIRAIEAARGKNMSTVGITAFDGGTLAKIADQVVHTPTDSGDYGPAEDAHLVVNHMLTELLRARLRSD